ncbi:DcrB-related protein [Salmonella enterica]|nr:DcrB-related protein [Salmonella enterica]EMA5837587.1 DcrB-related protein [Salmonella enterica]EMA6041704.1 DcrB-related protein [Salmonella enterica]
MKEYTLQEAVLPFPGEEWQDNSMNVFRHPQTQASVIISRGKCAQGRSFDEELDAQWALFRPLAEHLDIAPRQTVTLPDYPKVPARETCSTYRRSGREFHQWQLALLLPDGFSLLVITQTTLEEPSENDLLYRARLKRDLKLFVQGR